VLLGDLCHLVADLHQGAVHRRHLLTVVGNLAAGRVDPVCQRPGADGDRRQRQPGDS